MAFQCGENKFNGTANGLGVSFNKLRAEQLATQNAKENARDTVTAILLRNGKCPTNCPHQQVFDNTPVSTQVLRSAAKPKRKFFTIWFFIFPIIITYWQAQANSDWDLIVFCLEDVSP